MTLACACASACRAPHPAPPAAAILLRGHSPTHFCTCLACWSPSATSPSPTPCPASSLSSSWWVAVSVMSQGKPPQRSIGLNCSVSAGPSTVSIIGWLYIQQIVSAASCLQLCCPPCICPASAGLAAQCTRVYVVHLGGAGQRAAERHRLLGLPVPSGGQVAQRGPRRQLGLQPAAALRGGRGFAAPCPMCPAAAVVMLRFSFSRDPLYAPFHVSTLYMSHRGPSGSRQRPVRANTKAPPITC